MTDRALPRAGGEIGGFADDDETGGDPDADLQASFSSQLQLRHRSDQCKTGADRPLGVVLVCTGISEIGQHAVAHVFGHETIEPCDDLGSTMVGANDVAQILGVETCG